MYASLVISKYVGDDDHWKRKGAIFFLGRREPFHIITYNVANQNGVQKMIQDNEPRCCRGGSSVIIRPGFCLTSTSTCAPRAGEWELLEKVCTASDRRGNL